jgi:hypothetical protein
MVFEKGKHHTEKTIELMKQNHKRPWLGKILTEEHKEKKRNSMKEWWIKNKNNLQTLERNKKIGLKRKGILHTNETKQFLRELQTGRKHTQESKDKMSKSRRGHIFSKEHNQKISEARKGIHFLDITKEKLSLIAKERWKDEKYHKEFSESRIGKNNPNWHGGIQYEPYDNNWNRKFKNLIRKRDNQVCINCGKHREKLKYSLDVHHINYDKQLSIKENCISLCHSCHSLTQINRDYWTKFFQEKLSRLYNYKYTDDQKIIFDFNFENQEKGGVTKC